MAYDEQMAARVRHLLADEADLTTKPMFGSLAFLVRGNLLVTVGVDHLLIRVGDEAARLAADGVAEQAVMGQRTMKAWLRVPFAAVESEPSLREWVEHGLRWVRKLPE